MCGIVGVVQFERDAQLETDVLRQMCAATMHRGPDDEGIYTQGRVGLESAPPQHHRPRDWAPPN